MPGRPRTILFSGMIAADPHQGGATWAVLQYLLGFRELGHEVFFVEPVKEKKHQPAGTPLERSANAAYFRAVMAEFGFENVSALLKEGGRETVGLGYDDLRRAAGRADVLINVSGMLADERLSGRIPLRVFLDLDPAFVQVWHANYGIDMGFARHTHFVTVGQAIGRPSCPVPTCGVSWIPTLQPVALEHWPAVTATDGAAGAALVYDGLTTVANWRGYGSVEHQGVHYGQKAHSFRPFFSLPTRTPERLMPALAIHPDELQDLQALHANGWHLLDPARVAGSPDNYRRFVQGSKGEFGIAKAGYVASRCGWFSDRSVCYLASGRPVIAQDTGFGSFLPSGKGLFAFATPDDALSPIDALNADYAFHARAARALAEEHFDSRRVLSRLLREIGA